MENTLLNTNTIKIVGKLIDAKVTTGNRKDNGQGYISVDATVCSVINGVENEYKIGFYSNQTTKEGQMNKLYESYSHIPEYCLPPCSWGRCRTSARALRSCTTWARRFSASFQAEARCRRRDVRNTQPARHARYSPPERKSPSPRSVPCRLRVQCPSNPPAQRLSPRWSAQARGSRDPARPPSHFRP